MQCSNLNERLDTSQKALKDHEEANSRAQVESLQFRQRLEELERRQLPSTSTPYLDKLSNAHAVACNVLESCRVIAGHSALQPAQLDLSLMDRLTSTLEDIRRYGELFVKRAPICGLTVCACS